jgi:hypothetical protein
MTSFAETVLATCESKRLGPLTTRDYDSAVNRAPRFSPDSMHRRSIASVLENVIAEHVAFVKKVVEEGFDEAKARSEMTLRFGMALELGHTLAGVPNLKPGKVEITSVMSLVETELEYLKGFAAGQEAMQGEQRASLYGGGVEAAFYRGWVAALPTNATIHWRLGIAEHCMAGNAQAPRGCLGLAAASPYSKPGWGSNPLPTLPRNGDSKCLGNCRCFLEADAPNFKSHLRPKVGIEVIKIGAREIDPMSPAGMAWSQQYQDSAERIAYYRRMAELDSDPIWRARLEVTRSELDRTRARLGHDIRFTLTNDELMDPIRTAKARGLEFMPHSAFRGLALSSDEEFWIWLLAADYALHGQVMGVFLDETGFPAATLRDVAGRTETYDLGPQGRYIAFREPAS